MSSPFLRITKLDAAQRQLAEAIQLFFEQRDILCVHTLAGAAVNILNDLASHRGITRPARDSDRIRPERKREWLQALNAAQNFFKHADRNPDAQFDFRYEATPFLISEGVFLVGRLTQAWLPETFAFFLWFAMANPDLLKDGDLRNQVLAGVTGGVSPDDMHGWLKVLARIREQHTRGHWPPASSESAGL